MRRTAFASSSAILRKPLTAGGVVFTDIALAFVRDAAPQLYAAMTRNQEVHDAMRIVHRGQAIALPNNTFHRMARIDLLRTLREHCAELGLAIEFGRKVDRLDEFADCDLVVAADGESSAVRTRYRKHFEPSIDVRPNLQAWYGTTSLFDPISLDLSPKRAWLADRACLPLQPYPQHVSRRVRSAEYLSGVPHLP